MVTSSSFYRSKELKQVTSALLACESLLVIGEPGIGKSHFALKLAEGLVKADYPHVVLTMGTQKQTLEAVVKSLGIDPETLEGKRKSIYVMMDDVIDYCKQNQTIFIVDDAHRYAPSIRLWLERIMFEALSPVLLLATYPPARDIFLKLPRIELIPLADKAIREIMVQRAIALEVSLNNAQLAKLQASAGGNPMLAGRVVKEHYLGIKSEGLDHTQWIDGTPYVMAFLMLFVVVRFIGLGLNNTSLYLLGGVITTMVGVSRILIYSLPRKSTRLGR